MKLIINCYEFIGNMSSLKDHPRTSDSSVTIWFAVWCQLFLLGSDYFFDLISAGKAWPLGSGRPGFAY